jgi:hypothetical protein
MTTSKTISSESPEGVAAQAPIPSCALARSAFASDRLAERVKKAAPQPQ